MLPFCRCQFASGNCRSAIRPTLADIGRYYGRLLQKTIKLWIPREVPVYDCCQSTAFCGIRTILIGFTLLSKGV
ncbi:hypothetical protein BD310DRAFT_934675, partial [Dichomitus squalens]